MERKDVLAMIAIVCVAVLGALFAGSAALFGRSETLMNVRSKDAVLIEGLLREIANQPPGAGTAARIGAALNVLRDPVTGLPYTGLSVYYDEGLVASNAPPGDRRFVSGDTSTQEKELGGEWKLVVKRYEQRYKWNAWHSFLTVPMQQLRDGRDVTWDSIRRKALVPALVTFASGMTLALAFVAVLVRSRRRIRALESLVAVSMGQIEAGAARLAEIESNLDAGKSRAENLDSKIRDQESLVRRLASQWQKAVHDRELFQQEKNKLAADLKSSEVLLSELNDEKESLRLSNEASIRELEQRRAEVLAKTEEARQLQADLEERSNLAASRSEAQKKLLHRVWEVTWHDDALVEAFDMYRTGQPASRKRLTDLLARSVSGMPPRSGGSWEPMKPKAPEVRHNAHADQAKVYWYEPRPHHLCILAASGGADDHQRFDGGEVLRRRFQTMQAKLARQSR